MYTGHVALALAARGLRDDLPLWALVLAAQGCDWLELLLRLAVAKPQAEVWSHAYPYVVGAAAAVALIAWMWRRSVGAALALGFLYISHPIADYVTGFKVLWEGGIRVGLILVERPAADFVVQGGLCLVGWALYWNYLPRARRRHLGSVLPLIVLLGVQAVADMVLAAKLGPALREMGFSSTEWVLSAARSVSLV